jgi:hypothetical protein
MLGVALGGNIELRLGYQDLNKGKDNTSCAFLHYEASEVSKQPPPPRVIMRLLIV